MRQGDRYCYKGKGYIVDDVDEDTLSQDPETGDWGATVFYTSLSLPGKRFVRALSEWERKFRKAL